MSKENSMREELDKERQKREELEQKLQERLTAETDMQKEINLLREKLANIETSEKNIKIPESPIVTAANGGNKENGCEAITELLFSQMSSPGSSNGRGPNNSSSSSSFEVIERNSALHSKGLKEAQASSSDADPKYSLPGNPKGLERVSARVPVQSSVQHDSRLTLRPPGRVGNPPDLDKVNFSHCDVIKGEGTFKKGIPCEANSWPQQSDPWSGTGARPKNNSLPTNNPRKEDSEMNSKSEGQVFSSGTEPKVGENSKMFVQIPKDGGTFRINHLPPLNYGQDISLTGLSSILASNEEEKPTARKHTASETEEVGFNDLNSGTPRSGDTSLFSQMELLRKSDVDAILDMHHRTKDPQEHEMLLMSFSTPFQSTDAKSLTGQPQLTSEDVNLAGKLSSLVVEMKSKVLASEEVLDRFANFTEEVANLETRLKEYQVQIQKHQVHSSSLQAQSAEIQNLRKENKELRQLLHIPAQQIGTSSLSPESGRVSVAANDTDRRDEENKALEERLKDLTSLNNQLFFVNKQWEESWKLREHQFASQHVELGNKVQQLMKENQNLTKENQQLVKENQEFKGQIVAVNLLNDELKTLKHEKHELEQEFKVQESYLLKEKKMNSQIKAKYDLYHNTKGDSEIKVKELSEKISELKTDNVVLKEQLTMTIEDYDKEKKDRIAFEDQLKKLRAERNELKRNQDTKLKSANLMIKKREEEIYKKDKTIGDLQRMIDDLNGKLRTAERRTVLQPPSLFQGSQPSDAFCPSASPAYNPSQMQLLQEQKELAENPGEILVSTYAGLNDGRYQAVTSAEHSPESWACPNCTFINYPHVKICHMCGSARLPESSMLNSYSTLHSRDEWPGRDVPDSPEQIDVN